jgi:hypothetical protein
MMLLLMSLLLLIAQKHQTQQMYHTLLFPSATNNKYGLISSADQTEANERL